MERENVTLISDVQSEGAVHVAYNAMRVQEEAVHDNIHILFEGVHCDLVVKLLNGISSHSVKLGIHRFGCYSWEKAPFRVRIFVRSLLALWMARHYKRIVILNHDHLAFPLALAISSVWLQRGKVHVVSHDLWEACKRHNGLWLLWGAVRAISGHTHAALIPSSCIVAISHKYAQAVSYSPHPKFDLIYSNISNDGRSNIIVIFQSSRIPSPFLVNVLEDISNHELDKRYMFFSVSRMPADPLEVSGVLIETICIKSQDLESYWRFVRKARGIIIDYSDKYNYRCSGILYDALGSGVHVLHPEQPGLRGPPTYRPLTVEEFCAVLKETSTP